MTREEKSWTPTQEGPFRRAGSGRARGTLPSRTRILPPFLPMAEPDLPPAVPPRGRLRQTRHTLLMARECPGGVEAVPSGGCRVGGMFSAARCRRLRAETAPGNGLEFRTASGEPSSLEFAADGLTNPARERGRSSRSVRRMAASRGPRVERSLGCGSLRGSSALSSPCAPA
jgi:hypothetical protein